MNSPILNNHAFRAATKDIVQPTVLRDIEARIIAYLTALPAQDSLKPKELLVNGGLKLDALKCEVTLDGEPIAVTRKRFGLLMFFMKNVGRVVDTREILRNVWGAAHTEDVHYLRVHLSDLRTALKEPKDNPRFIKTVLGRGYMMMEDRHES